MRRVIVLYKETSPAIVDDDKVRYKDIVVGCFFPAHDLIYVNEMISYFFMWWSIISHLSFRGYKHFIYTENI